MCTYTRFCLDIERVHTPAQSTHPSSCCNREAVLPCEQPYGPNHLIDVDDAQASKLLLQYTDAFNELYDVYSKAAGGQPCHWRPELVFAQLLFTVTANGAALLLQHY